MPPKRAFDITFKVGNIGVERPGWNIYRRRVVERNRNLVNLGLQGPMGMLQIRYPWTVRLQEGVKLIVDRGENAPEGKKAGEVGLHVFGDGNPAFPIGVGINWEAMQ